VNVVRGAAAPRQIRDREETSEKKEKKIEEEIMSIGI
jgi:hypothetical protein